MREEERERMVAEQIIGRGIRDVRVIAAMRRIPRHAFLPEDSTAYRYAYIDSAQPIAAGQTISQPYMVAVMTEALALTGSEKVLEIGAGSGYQTALLCELADSVIAIERHAELARTAQIALDFLGFRNVELLVGDGSRGWPEFAPYDAILVAANAPAVPPQLLAQLAPGGRLIMPVGPENGEQRLLRIEKDRDGEIRTEDLGAVSFVPLIGASGYGLPDDLGLSDI